MTDFPLYFFAICYAYFMVVLFFFILGTAVGSFLTVAIDRLPKNVSIVHGRSFCESCKHSLSWLDLIPLFSFLFLRGKCRYCHRSIGVHHLLMEILVGVLFVITYLATITSFSQTTPLLSLFIGTLSYRLVLVSIFFVIFFIDLRHSIIPFSAIALAGFVALLWTIFTSPSLLPSLFLTAIGSFLFFFIIHAVTRGRGMGFGDVIFAFVMGFLLGFPTTIVGIYIAFLTGAIVSLILLLQGKKKLKSAIPFGPFLVFGTLLCLLWGTQLTNGFLVLLRII